MMMRSIRLSTALGCCLSITLAGAACSGTGIRPWPQQLSSWGYEIGPAVDTVRNYSVQSFRSVDDRHLVIETGPSTAYFITLAADCAGLHAAETLGFSSTDGDLAPSDDLIIHQVDANFRCPLQAINTLQRKG